MVEGQEFTCPDCGSHAFGTSALNERISKGFCHGSKAAGCLTGRHDTASVVPCTFNWDRTPEGDAKVFKGNGHFSPRVQTGTVVR